jgi:Glyoxalase-like domain
MSITPAVDVLDHLLLGVPDLDEGIAFVERLTGVRAVVGGSHPGRGTRNALVALSGRQYLEIIAPDPDQEVVSPLSTLASPALGRWAAVTDDIEGLAGRLRAAGFETSGPHPGSRRRPDGGVLSWKTLALPQTFALGPLDPIPFFIEWDAATLHPSEDSPPAGELLSLELHHPDPESLRQAFEKMGIDATVCEAPMHRIVAAIRTSSGIVSL